MFGSLSIQVSHASLNVAFQFNGKGNWSIDGVGSNNTPVGTISGVVPPGSTVVKAYLYSTLYDNFTAPSAPTVVLDGTSYGPSDFVGLGALSGLCCPTTLQLQAFRADVTSQVAAKVGSGSALPFSFSIDSESPNANVDGDVLAIIYSNPAELERTIAFLEGASSATGDATTFTFVSPVDTSIPGFEALMSLGIGFSFQPGGQVSLVDGDGRRLSSSAGGQDDGGGFNGGLITVGGLGDSPTNPDPFAPSSDVRTDDELYNLALGNSADPTPFLLNGATSFSVTSSNPSFNDNIFFLGLNVTAQGTVSTGLSLSPPTATNDVGEDHTVTATATSSSLPVAGVTINFTVTGAHSTSGSCVTGADGTCTFTYTGVNPGTDTIVATAVINGQAKTATASKEWIVPPNVPPVCSGAVACLPTLWPPNHKYQPVSICGVFDPDSGDVVTITVTGITQDEPTNTRGDGNTCPDGQIVNGEASVRAERTGTPGIPGDGRVYRIYFTASDGDTSCTGSVTVCVPHDQGQGSTCVDSGQNYNSLGPCNSGNQLAQEVTEVGLRVGTVTGTQAVLEFALPQDAQVELSVFDVAGRRLATVENGPLAAGLYQRAWDMSGATKGLYFVRLRAGAVTLTRTVVKLR